MSDEKTRKAWVVEVNTDLNEGRGSNYVKHICDMEATAIRLAKGANVQGSNGHVREVELVWKSGWWGPVHIVEPRHEDKLAQPRLDARRAAYEKAKSLGLTEEEIRSLT